MRHVSTFVTGAAFALSLLHACARAPAPEGPEAQDEPGEELEAAAMPYRILAVPGGAELSWDEFLAEVGGASAVCLGERHDNPHHHWAQLEVVRGLIDPEDDGEAALGMEMFQRPFQGVLDDYVKGRIGEEAMLERTGWDERWGYDYGLYRPMVEAAREGGARILALNARRELVRKVSREGFEALSPSEREALPTLDLGDAEHHAWFWDVMDALGDQHPRPSDDEPSDDEPSDPGDGEHHGESERGHGDGEHPHAEGDHGHGGHDHGHGETEGDYKNGASPAPDDAAANEGDLAIGAGDALVSPDELTELDSLGADDRLYAAQVIWDETMADTAAEFLASGDDRRVVILAGNGHCHDTAVVSRIERRGDFEAVSVRPVIDTGEGAVSALIAEDQHDFLFVLEPPDGAGH